MSSTLTTVEPTPMKKIKKQNLTIVSRKVPNSNVIYVNSRTINPQSLLKQWFSSSSPINSNLIEIQPTPSHVAVKKNTLDNNNYNLTNFPSEKNHNHNNYYYLKQNNKRKLELNSKCNKLIKDDVVSVISASCCAEMITPNIENHQNEETSNVVIPKLSYMSNIISGKSTLNSNRSETPDSNKSYAAIEANVACSMKREPELHIEFDGTTVLCRVCGDKASGFHYGVHSCEGCKGFFRRSIQQKIQYRPCTKNQQCSVLRINRNRCQYCRLKKCIAVGMSRDAVRFGRVPKREKARILAAMHQSTQNRGHQRHLAIELEDQSHLLQAVLRAHLETCEFTIEKVTAMRQRAKECPSYSIPSLLACPLNPAPELQSEQEFSERFAHVIRGVIDFAGMVPGFQLLNQDDKFTLLKAGLFDALFIRLICMFDSSINSIICLNGQVMQRDSFKNGANARFLVDSTFNFAERINSMDLTDAEIGLFCAIVLITPDRPGLRNIELIDKMYTRLKSCLQSVITQNRPDQLDFMPELLKTIPDLRTLSTLHTEKLVVFRTEHKELLRQQMWQMEDDQSLKSPASNVIWEDRDGLTEDIVKSPLGSVSSSESSDIEYSRYHHSTPVSLKNSTPLLAASLSSSCPLRSRVNSGSSAEEVDAASVSHSHLMQNGITITPVARSHLLYHNLNGQRHPYRKLDSPTDSGIESGNEKADFTKTVSSGSGSSCSSPRSSVDDVLDTDTCSATILSQQSIQQKNTSSLVITSIGATNKRQVIEDMPVLKRVLQAPPLYDTSSLMMEAYKPHKKFRALRHKDFDVAETDVTTNYSMQQSLAGTTVSNTRNTNTANLNENKDQLSHLHMHLTSNTNKNTATISDNTHIGKSTNECSRKTNLIFADSVLSHQHSQYSSLSRTHSVLAQSLMGEPHMTPEQMKRSDIIQNYIMRDQPPQRNNLSACATIPIQSRSVLLTPSSVVSHQSNFSSSGVPVPRTTMLDQTGSNSIKWLDHNVGTQISGQHLPVSSHSSKSTDNSKNIISSSFNHAEVPHSTSITKRSTSQSNHTVRLLKLKVGNTETQQPLNLSKKLPTPPPRSTQNFVPAVVHKHFSLIAADAVDSPSTPGSAEVLDLIDISTIGNKILLDM